MHYYYSSEYPCTFTCTFAVCTVQRYVTYTDKQHYIVMESACVLTYVFLMYRDVTCRKQHYIVIESAYSVLTYVILMYRLQRCNIQKTALHSHRESASVLTCNIHVQYRDVITESCRERGEGGRRSIIIEFNYVRRRYEHTGYCTGTVVLHCVSFYSYPPFSFLSDYHHTVMCLQYIHWS